MNIAYYEENNYHTEILGTFLEPFIKNNSNITVFNNSDNSDYITYFQQIINYQLKKINDFADLYTQFDIIIVGTSSTCSFLSNPNFNLSSIKSKIYMISHLVEDLEKVITFYNIVLTPLNQNSNNLYILPINNFYTQKQKNYNTCRIIGLVGRFKDSNRDIKDLINLVSNYSHLNFCIKIFTRHKKFIPNEINLLQSKYPNKILIYYKISTNNLIKQLNTINYFCPLSSQKSWYLKDRLSGMIPFAYNFNTPLLLDSLSNQIYKLKSTIVYKTSLCEIIEDLCVKTEINYLQLIDDLIEEKKEICESNNQKLDKLFEIV